MLSKSIRTEVVINAEPAKVWSVFINWAAYSEWNSFIRALDGEPREGAVLQLAVQPPGKGVSKFQPRVLKAKPNKEFRWQGKLAGLPGLFTGEHYFIFEDAGEGRTKLLHGEDFSGMFIPLVGAADWAAIQQGFQDMNAALKERAEAAS